MTSPSGPKAVAGRGPTFLIAGVMKGGTSSLHWYLDQHPQVFMTTRKELHFFDRPPAWRVAALDQYLARFDDTGRFTARGESSPSYCYAPGAMAAIAEYDPQMKIIISLRDPVDRAISHIEHRHKISRRPHKTLVHFDIWEELARDLRTQPLQPGAQVTERSRGYHVRGHYHQQLRRMYEHFPTGQVLVLRLEDFRSDAAGQLNRVTDFLGIARHTFDDLAPSNVNQYERPEAAVYEYLAAYYLIHNRILTEDYGIRTDDWRTPASPLLRLSGAAPGEPPA